jgi:plasmid stabilization system protein ParE
MTARAEEDRDRAFEWYAANYSIEFAIRWFNGITRAMRSLSNRPERCHRARESEVFNVDVLELLHGRRRTKHRILFQIYNDMVLVLRIRHSAQDELKNDEI